jgi:hypothetical protein
MRKLIFGLALLGTVAVGATAQAAGPYDGRTMVQPVYWNGDYCGPRCQEFRWRRHERWEARREWRHRRWEDRRYGYYAYPRY